HPRNPPGERRPVSHRRRGAGDAAVAQPDLRQLRRAAAVGGADLRRPRGAHPRQRRRHRLDRPRQRDRLAGRRNDQEHHRAGDAGQPGRQTPPRDVRPDRGDARAVAEGPRAAGVGDQLRAVRRLCVRSRGDERRRGANLPRRPPAVRQARAVARRSDRRAVGEQAGRRSGDLRRLQAAQRRGDPDQQPGAAGQQPRAHPTKQMQKFTDLFVRRPVLAIVVNLVILIAGLQSIRALSVRQYPRSDIAVVKVSTAYVGANADLVRGFITSPLERVLASADGIDYMESSSAQSVSTITVHLKLNYNTNDALTQIQSKVAEVRNDLPPEAQAPVIQVQTADAQFAAMYLGFSSKDLDQNQISDYLVRVVQPRLSAVAGVQK